MKILVTGGAGYIGSIMTRQLCDEGYSVVVCDNLSSGYKDAVDSRAEFMNIDLSNKKSVSGIFSKHRFDAVIHFAGVISARESMINPGKYFMENTSNTLQLLDIMNDNDVKFMIFSSTAAVYGDPESIPINEFHRQSPTSVYGESKKMIESVFNWYDAIHDLKSASLRYFNASGASLDGKLGERHKDETHIIPLAINAIIKKIPFLLYGSDYSTKDGTCIRDYIHVEDLCSAHLVVLKDLLKQKITKVYNVGTGNGYSNREIIDTIEQISGKTLKIMKAERRSGDPTQLIADPSKIKNELGWQPKYSDLPTIIKTAWEFHKTHGISN